MAVKEHVLLGAFAAIESAHFYSSFLPSLMTIRKFAEDEDAINALRQGETIATAFALGLGWVVSELVDDYLPLIFSAGVAVLMLLVYEFGISGVLNGATFKNAGAITAGQVLPFVPQPGWQN